MESINRKTEMNELRISKVESLVKMGSSQTADHKNEMETPERHRQRNKRNVFQTQTTQKVSLQQLRLEIKEKFNQACGSKDKICEVGPPGPPGLPGNRGAHGYPGYKGEKGATGISGPQGPLGPKGVPGPRGSQGRQGPQGDMGDEGPRGIPGLKGDVGRMGRPGQKGSIGLKGNKGKRGYTGLQGPKGECVVDPKIRIYPVSQEVFINRPAIFYCWVDGQTSKQITWSKLGGALLRDTTVKDGALHINHVQRSHVGSYMCTAYTGHGILKAISNLHLKEPPIFTNKPSLHVGVKRGSNLNLCCEAKGYPRPSIEWSRAQQSPDLLPAFQENGCLKINAIKENEGDYICRATNRFGLAETTTKVIVTLTDQQGWTLIARFSNNDNKNWMRDDGLWWYDQHVAMGKTTDPLINADMISPAFWLISGREFKITRSDDPSHTPLLQTTANCLAGQTFRSKIESYGDFRNGKVWASAQCLGSCTVQHGGQYKSTDGFQQAECNGNIQSANKIGFWCDSHARIGYGDGSVMMIGGGGSSCDRADHGIGISEADEASFYHSMEYDFGYDTGSSSQSYSLNVWIR